MSLEKCSIDKIISGTKGEKKEVEDFFSEKFSNPKIEEIERLELKKSEEQIETINLVNDETNKLLERYGLEKFDIGPDNVHLLNSEVCKNFSGLNDTAFFIIPKQAIFVNQDSSFPRTLFTHQLFHEFIHFKSHQEIHISKNRVIVSKTGVAINPKLEVDAKKENKYFSGINEAITEELAIRFQKDVLRNHPNFEKENGLIEEYVEQKKQNEMFQAGALET